MTLPRLCNTHELLFLVVGEEKADAAARAFAGEPTPAIPGSLARATAGTTRAVLDRAAAANL
jgi:6-phosphogluconolactonase/glucosamine-6-phosphate isomerase/deaminase